jgi:hypothetical protein
MGGSTFQQVDIQRFQNLDINFSWNKLLHADNWPLPEQC